MKARIVKWSPRTRSAVVESFLKRPAFDDQAERVARRILADVAADGDRAVAAHAEKVDKARLKPSGFRVTAAELRAAEKRVDAEFKAAAQEAHRRVTAFAEAGLKPDWRVPTPRGGMMGEQFVPLDRVGVYVPGGAAPLVSTVLMTVPLARVAGVPEIVACTPCGPDLAINPYILYALKLSGATEIYRVGGIQSIGMMAFGTRTVPKVQKIVGPGGAYVTAAKRQVYGHVALDLVAGPSEIAVLADDSARPDVVAADLLSQAEHGTGHEKALLVTNSTRLAREVQAALQTLTAALSRREAIERVTRKGILLTVVRNLELGMELCNRFAPEHLEIMVRGPRRWLPKVRCAGAVFLGPWTPESAGDFVAGPSHVLPTGGAAAMFSGLSVDDFFRRSSFMSFTRADLRETLPIIEAFGRVEGLDAHALSASRRFRKP